MKKKKILFFVLAITMFIPQLTLAKESEEKYEKVSEETKYYKTIIYNNMNANLNSINSNNEYTQTIEISKEEYDAVTEENSIINGNGITNTDYKKLTTEIFSNGSYYRYKATLNWKTMPSTRSYDVIAIGNLSNVIYSGGTNFSQYYCTTSGECKTLTSYYSKTSSTGCGAAFKLPEGSINVLSQSFSFNVAKNTSSTVTYQAAYGDYSHATSNVTSTQAQSYSVGTSGISFSGGVGSYYDNIMPAMATWNGSW